MTELKRPLCVGLTINSLAGDIQQELLSGISARARQDGINLLLIPGHRIATDGLFESQFNILYPFLQSPRFDAIVSCTAYYQGTMNHDEMIAFINRYAHVPTINLNFEMPGCASVLVDNRAGFYALMQHLIHDHGYRRFAFMHGIIGNADADERFAVFRECLDEAGLAYDPRLVGVGHFSNFGAREAMIALLDQQLPFDVLVAANDGMAEGCIAVAVGRGLRVPQDIAVTGFDNETAYSRNGLPLTTVDQPVRLLANVAIDLLQAQLRGEAVPHITRVPTGLVIRPSCGCIHKIYGQHQDDAAESVVPHAHDVMIEQLKLMPALVPQYRRYLVLLEQSLPQGADAFEDCLSKIAQACLAEMGDLSRLQLLLLLMFRQLGAQPNLSADQKQHYGEVLFDGQLVLATVSSTSTARSVITADPTEFMFQAVGFVRRQMSDFNFDTMLGLIETSLRGLAISCGYIVLYEKPLLFAGIDGYAPPAEAKVIFSMRNGVRQFEGLNRPFPTMNLLPEDVFHEDGGQVLALFPIFQHTEHFGYMILDLSKVQSPYIEQIRDEISTCLINCLQADELTRARDLLKQDLGVASRHNERLLEEVLELNRRLQALFNAALEVAIIATDTAGKINVFNLGAQKMLGYTAQEVLGQSLTHFHLESEIQQRASELTQQLGRPIAGFEIFSALSQQGSSEIHNWTYVRHDGGQLQVSLVTSAVIDEHGVVDGFLCIARDISEQVVAQGKLLELNQQLDLRVQQRTQALQESTHQLEKTLEHLQMAKAQLVQSEKLAALGSIVAAVAHELNTPLGISVTLASTMHFSTEAMEKDLIAGNLRRSQLDHYVNSIHQGTEMLERSLDRACILVNNFKQVAVDQTSEKRRAFHLKEVIDGVVELITTSLRKTPYTLALDVAHDLQMDSYPGAIEQIVSNLVNNSVLHGFEGREQGQMRLSAWAEVAGGAGAADLIHLQFCDDGIGMDENVVRHIFDPFFTTKLGKGGSGLGMSICYNLVTGPLGGSISVCSVPGQGSTFTLILPRTAPM